MSKPLAAIDVGTNTFRLLIADVLYNPQEKNYSINEIRSERIVTRLGEGIADNGLIREQAVERSIAALRRFKDILSGYCLGGISVVATSALRDAGNGAYFLKKIKEATGFDIKIISGEEEAEKTAAGMLIDIKMPESAFLVDIGGGSTEVIFTGQHQPQLVQSLRLGVVYLTDKYMKNDPPSSDDLSGMSSEVSGEISTKAASFKKLFTGNTVFIGTAGTVTALAAIIQKLTSFDHGKIHNTRIAKNEIKNVFSVLSSVTAVERSKYLPFEPTRLDIIVPGTLILLKLMDIFDFEEIIVSNYGLREGILLNLYDKNTQKA